MFQDWKQAWRQAVENFQRELDDDGGDEGTRAMRRDERIASEAQVRLDAELARARKDAAAERESETVCRRREALAAKVSDAETARIAADYAARHAERAAILERKAEVLEQERALLLRDLEHMRSALAARGADPQVAAANAGAARAADSAAAADPSGREREDFSFRKMEREARERAAEQRLEELKRKLR
jgi:hypothetical protein